MEKKRRSEEKKKVTEEKKKLLEEKKRNTITKKKAEEDVGEGKTKEDTKGNEKLTERNFKSNDVRKYFAKMN